MKLLDLLRPEHVLVPLRAPTVRDAVDLLVDRLEDEGAIRASESLHQRLREEAVRDAVAISDDVLLPHARSEAVSSLAIALGVSPDGVASDGGNGARTPRIVVLILAPQDAAPLYLQATSTLARLLDQPDVVERIAAQSDAAAILGLPELQGLRIQPSLAVRDVMVHRIHSVSPETPVRSALDLMLRRKLQAVPVVGRKGEVLGMVSDGDMMRVLLPQIPRAGGGDRQASGARPLDRPVRDIMTRSVLCVSEDLGVSEVANMMINKNVEQVPVVQAGTITGMVSRGDIIRKLFGRT